MHETQCDHAMYLVPVDECLRLCYHLNRQMTRANNCELSVYCDTVNLHTVWPSCMLSLPTNGRGWKRSDDGSALVMKTDISCYRKCERSQCHVKSTFVVSNQPCLNLLTCVRAIHRRSMCTVRTLLKCWSKPSPTFLD